MAGSVNKVILVGNLGAPPDIRRFADGGCVANLRLATSDSWRDKNTGERKERTEWHNIAVFNEGLIKVIEQYVKKGAKLYIEGSLQTRKWQDQQGQDRYSTEVALRPFNGTIQLLDSKPQDSGSGGAGAPAPANTGYGYADAKGKKAAAAPRPDYPRDIDDEVPF